MPASNGCLQPLNAGIIKNFKVKFRIILMHYVLAGIAHDWKAHEIVNEINVAQVIEWISSAWKKVSKDTIKKLFFKIWSCGATCIIDVDEDFDGEFNNLFEE